MKCAFAAALTSWSSASVMKSMNMISSTGRMPDCAAPIATPVMAASLGLVVTYGFYALSALVSFFFVRAMVHETKGVELENMQG